MSAALPGISIRPGGVADAPAAAACVDAAFGLYVERMGQRPAPMQADYAALAAAGQLWVAEQGGGLVGVLVHYATPEGWCIDTVASAPQARGMGVGRALLVFAEREALARGFSAVCLYTHEKMTENQAFDPRIGFVETGRRTQDGFSRVFYRKTLG